MKSEQSKIGKPPSWKLYERLTAFIASQGVDAGLRVHPNVTLRGHISGIERQIDVLIECRISDYQSKRIIVDAKLHRRPLNIQDVEKFEGMIKDVRADRGILVCPNGFSEVAKRRAQRGISIKLLKPDELIDAKTNSWDICASDQCGVRISRAGCYEVWVLYDEVFHVGMPDGPVSPVAIGKCDVCSRFNVWCWNCGQKFALESNEDEASCNCNRFWLTSVECGVYLEDGVRLESVCLTVVMIYQGLAVKATISQRAPN